MKKILLVDNVKAILERGKSMLNRKDFQVYTATSGEEALELHAKEKMDAIIIDLKMPGMSGDEVCRKIRSAPELKKVSIIMAVLSDDPADLELCKKSGANACLLKPLQKDDLLSILAKFLEVPRRQAIRILVKVKLDAFVGGEFFIANTVDVSATGLLFECDRELKAGDVVEASFFLPGADGFHRIVAGSQVVRVVPGEASGTTRYGVSFQEFKEGNSGQIEEFVREKTLGK